MGSTTDEVAIDEQAARVALAALFGTIPEYQPLDEGHVRIAPDAALLPIDAAARLLASMPKPLLCYAENVNGTLAVTCELVDAASDEDREHFELRLATEVEGRQRFDHLLERYGEGDHLIAVFGHTNVTCVPLSAVRQWSRDYEIEFSGLREDDANNPGVESDPEYATARKHGAKGILQFTSPAANFMTADGTLLAFPPAKNTSPHDREKLERAMLALAKARLLYFEDEEEIATVERVMVARGEIPADSIEGAGRDRERWWNHMFASQLEYLFKDRPMPAEAAAFIDACRLSRGAILRSNDSAIGAGSFSRGIRARACGVEHLGSRGRGSPVPTRRRRAARWLPSHDALRGGHAGEGHHRRQGGDA
jgi:hypothetical protein